MSLLSMIKGKGPTGFGYGSTAEQVTQGIDLTGKTVLITGCNSGLGEETMRVLASRGARIIAAARTVEKAERASKQLGIEARPVACELSEPESVKECVKELVDDDESIDVILCNAGIMALPKLTLAHGYELQFFTNHIGHFMLITGLLDQLTDDARVLLVSSSAHQFSPSTGIDFDNLDGSKGYSPWRFYGQSKVANLLCARELAHRFEGTNKIANALHPGVIMTNLGRHSQGAVANTLGDLIGKPLFLKNVHEGAATQTFLAAHPEARKHSGEYFADCNVAKSNSHGRDMDLAARLWARSEEIVATFN